LAAEPVYFASPATFRAWLKKHHATKSELLVGFHKRDSGLPSITWPESVDEALSFGWIDGVRKSLGETSYTIRFTPRRSGSIWSAVNIRRVEALTAEGRMQPAGLAAFAARTEARSRTYSFEQPTVELGESYLSTLRRNRAAWKFFEAQPPWYRKQVSWWVMSAKKEETRERRLERLIEASATGKRI
jgi:uncharacterized protein YdeI (YjbR/CyaY-like superfamily)